MPRPKRTKVATTASTTTIPPKQRDVSKAPAGRVATTSDDSEDTVTTGITLENRWGIEKRDVFISGGLGTGDAQDAHRKPGATRRKLTAVEQERTTEQARAIEGLKKRREAALTAQKVSVVEVPSSIPVPGAEDEGFPVGGNPDTEVIGREGRVNPGTGSRARDTPGAEASILALANFKRRPRQPSILRIAQQDAGNADDDLYDASDAEEHEKTAVDQVGHTQPEEETGFGPQGTPGAEVSILALANFKRRPRQPNILQTVQPDDGTVDDDLYDATDAEEDEKTAAVHMGHLQPEDEFGTEAQGTPGAEVSILALANFKRRPRQPSILEVAVQQGVSNGNDHDLYDDDDVDPIGAFQPEDESTPFIVSKSKPQIEAILSPSPSSPTPESLPGSNSKKRKLTPAEVQVPRSSPPEARSPPSTGYQHNENYVSPALHDDDQEPPSEQLEAHSDRAPTPQIWSDTLAPPLSSSPSQPTTHSPPRREQSAAHTTAQKKRKQPARNNPPLANRNDSPTKSSNLAAKVRSRTCQPLSTATLQTLLPRRRTRARPSTFDIPSSGDHADVENEETDTSIPVNDDDDELSHPPAKKPGTRKPATNTASTAAAVTKKPPPVKKQRAAAAAKKAAAVAAAGAAGPSSKAKRTYTRRVVSDKDKEKENADPDPEASHDDRPQDEVDRLESGEEGEEAGVERIRIGGPELERAARWFREVGKWELEFEEVTGSSDSMMRDAR